MVYGIRIQKDSVVYGIWIRRIQYKDSKCFSIWYMV